MVVDVAFLERVGKLVAFSQQPRYERTASRFLDKHGSGLQEFDEQWVDAVAGAQPGQWAVVERFVAASPHLSEVERQMLLGWLAAKCEEADPANPQASCSSSRRTIMYWGFKSRLGHQFWWSS